MAHRVCESLWAMPGGKKEASHPPKKIRLLVGLPPLEEASSAFHDLDDEGTGALVRPLAAATTKHTRWASTLNPIP